MNIKTILNSGNVVRFHNHAGIDKQKNSEHEWGTALIVQHIFPECSKELLLAALTHDAHEYFTGDIPFPVKQSCPELKSMLASLESKWEAENGIDKNLTSEEKVCLKIADVLEGMWYCLVQVRQGNINAKRPFRKWRTFLIDFLIEQNTNRESQLGGIINNAYIFLNQLVRTMEEQ